MWRLKAPEKKPLVRRGDPDEKQRPIRRASQKKVNPNIEMSKYEQNIWTWLILKLLLVLSRIMNNHDSIQFHSQITAVNHGYDHDRRNEGEPTHTHSIKPASNNHQWF